MCILHYMRLEACIDRLCKTVRRCPIASLLSVLSKKVEVERFNYFTIFDNRREGKVLPFFTVYDRSFFYSNFLFPQPSSCEKNIKSGLKARQ